MTFIENVRQKFSETWLRLSISLHEAVKREGPQILYALSVVAALAQVSGASSFSAFSGLLALLSGVGQNLLANRLENSVDPEQLPDLLSKLLDKIKGLDEWAAARVVQTELQNSPGLLAVTDHLLEKIKALPLAQQAFNQNVNDEIQRKWFAEAMPQALAAVGSSLQINARVKAGKRSAVAVGPKAKARTTNLTAKGRNAKNIVAKRGGVAANKIGKIIMGNEQNTGAEQLSKRRYLENLRTACNLLPLSVHADDRNPHRDATIGLSQVYIDLNTTTPREEPQRERKPKTQQREEQPPPLSALEVAMKHEAVVLLGDPGSGKSSFTNHLLFLCAGYQLDKKQKHLPKGWPAKQSVPVKILLRDLSVDLQAAQAHACLSLADDARDHKLVNLIESHLEKQLHEMKAAAFADELHAFLTAGRCLVVLDGLDEVPPEARELMRAAIKALRLRRAANRYIVTCRVRSWDDEKTLPSFQVSTLGPFNDDQVQQFIQHWYGALQQAGQFSQVQTKTRIESMQKAIGVLERDLVQNPLLLTTMAVVHFNDADLPRERVKLYKRAAEVLLKRWQQHRAGKAGLLETLGIGGRELYPALWELAYHAHSTAGSEKAADLPRSKAIEILERHFAALEKPWEKANIFLEYVDQRAGILVGRGGLEKTVYAFPHRTFQEYFAGTYLTKRREGFDRELLKKLEHGDYWQVAAQLGLEDLLHNAQMPNLALNAAYALCPNTAIAEHEQALWRGILWSAHFAEEIGQERIKADTLANGGQSYLDRLIKNLVKLLEHGLLPARERAEAGFVLGKLGDPREGVCALPPLWVELPGGKFMMGSDEGRDNEKPPHEVELSPFKISKYPITNAQFEIFMNEGGYQNEKWWSKEGWKYRQKENWEQPRYWENEAFNLPNQPVVAVSWFEAEAFCNWLSEKSKEQKANGKQIIRLPTEAEWEFAARGREGRKFPWGKDEPTPEHANYEQSQIGRQTAVGIYSQGATPEGIFDLAGNVWEWCLDFYDEKYYAACKKAGVVKDPLCTKESWWRIQRGGAYYSDADGLRGSGRVLSFPVIWLRNYGFRVCVAVEP